MPKLTAEYVRSRIAYDAETGVLTWKPRAAEDCIAKMWNTRFAGRQIDHKLACGHIQFGLDGRNYLAHRVAWLIVYGDWPASILDHINGDPCDNRLSNLRLATRSQNACNSKRRTNNSSGYRGVCWFARQGMWAARIGFGGERVHLGYFDDPVEAAHAYDNAARRLHGEFATPNSGGAN